MPQDEDNIVPDLIEQMERLRDSVSYAETLDDVREAFRNMDIPLDITSPGRSLGDRLLDLEDKSSRLDNVRGVGGIVVHNLPTGIQISKIDEDRSSQEDHNILGAEHTDSDPAAAVEGDLIYGASGDDILWSRLPIGDSNEVLTVSGGVPSWEAPGGADDKYVKVEEDDTETNFLDNKVGATGDGAITAEDVWITKCSLPIAGENAKTLYLNHGVCTTKCICLTFTGAGSVSGGGSIEVDAKGHVIGACSMTLTGTDSDEKVKVCAGDTAAYLEDQVVGDNTWISVAIDTGKMKTSHIGPGPCACTVTGLSGGIVYFFSMEIDEKGHVRYMQVCNDDCYSDGAKVGPCGDV